MELKQQDLFSFPSYKITKDIRLIELFAGVGSQMMSLRNLKIKGVIKQNIKSWRVVEFDKYAINSYNAIHHTNYSVSDVTKINGSDLGITQTDLYEYILTYSFPCTDLSVAGKGLARKDGLKRGTATRSGLLWQVERLLNECEELPQILLMENVPQVTTTEGFDDWCEYLKQKGYVNHWQILNAKDYGVAQNRERCFMISILSPDYVDYIFPDKIPLTKTVQDYLEDNVEEKFYINNEKAAKLILDLETKDILPITDRQTDSHTQNIYILEGTKMNDTNPECINLYDEDGKETKFQERIYKTDKVTPAITTAFRPCYMVEEKIGIRQATEKGFAECKIGGVADLSFPSSSTRRGRVQDNGDTSPTLTTDTNGISVIEARYRIRKLTPKECWRLMDFNDEDFDNAAKVTSNSQLYKQAGNSIVVSVLEGIFAQLF